MTTTILVGDARTRLAELAAGSVQTCVTSPPYFGLRDYGVDGQIGLESTVESYVAELVEVFRGVRRVLRDDGTLWLNLGDSYCSTAPNTMGAPLRQSGILAGVTDETAQARKKFRPKTPDGLKPKDLIGIPWRVAFALQADGWYLRSDIIWHKPNPMPESVTDRPTKAHEYLFLLTKSERYYYDAAAIAEPASGRSCGNRTYKYDGVPGHETKQGILAVSDKEWQTRNRRTVWTIATKPFRGAHFAVFPPALVEPCVLAGTSERGQCPACGAPWSRVVERESRQEQEAWSGAARANGCVAGGGHVGRTGQWSASTQTTGWQPSCACNAGDPVPQVALDPFGGSGTTALVANQHGRDAILVELNPAYAELARERIGGALGMFAEVEVAA